MAVVIDPTYGPKPALRSLGGMPTSLPQGSSPFLPQGRGITTLDGGIVRTVSFANIYRSQPWVGTGCRRMSEAIMRLPLHLFKYLDADGETRGRDRGHAAATLLQRPRPRQRTPHFLWELALSTYVHGNSVHWKRRLRGRGGPPGELWALDWRLLMPILADGVSGRVVAWKWLGYGIPGLRHGEEIFVEDTLHIAFGAPGGGDVGISPLEQLAVTVRSEQGLQRLTEAQARNGTRLGLAAILDKAVKADKVRRDGVREELSSVHGGLDNAFHNVVLGGGITDLKTIPGQTAVEAELLGQREFNREEVMAVIGLPQPLGGILDDSNYSALFELHRMLYTTSLGGPLALIAASLQAQLLDAEPVFDADDRFLDFNLGEVLKGDPKTRWETYSKALECGGLTLNDVRRMENLPPYADKRADEPLIAANNVRPLSAIGQADPAKITLNATPEEASARLVGVLSAHVGRAFERAARGAGKGELPTDALDRGRVARELGEDLKAIGLNGSSEAIAETLADELELELAGARTIDDVRGAAADHPLNPKPGDA